MIQWIKRFFCKHDMVFNGPHWNPTLGGHMFRTNSVFTCKKCGYQVGKF